MKYNCYHHDQCSKYHEEGARCADCAFYTPVGDEAERDYVDKAIEQDRIAFRSEWFSYTDYFFT